MSDHPSRRQLKRFLARRLSEAEERTVSAHVETCGGCQHALDRLLPADGRRSPRERSLDPAGAGLQDRPSEEFLARLKGSTPAGTPAPLGISFPDPLDGAAGGGRLGPYRILQRLRGGGVGAVFKARDESLGRLVAVKVLAPHLAGVAENRRRFEAEARAAAALCHENIVPIHHVGALPGSNLPYIVMEYIDGPDLAARMRAAPPLDAREAADIARQVALGLAQAHEHGVVHRDVKPSNVLLQRKGGRWHARLADFGIARVVQQGDRAGEPPLTRSGSLLGTPPYMSPEQVRSAENLDHRSDVYGLGVVLYELLAGRLPFGGATAYETLLHVTQRHPRPPHLVNPAAPPALSTVCLKCLQKRPADRYRSAHELAVDLEAWLAGERVRARLPGLPTRLLGRCRDNRLVVGLAALLVALLSACAALGMWYHEARRQARTALGETRRQEALLALERGLAQCERGEAGRGLLWLARALRLAPDDGLRRACRAQLAAWRGQVAALRAVLPHEGPVVAAAFSPDGKTILTGSELNARLWDAATGEPIRTFDRHGAINALSFSPDGRFFYAGFRREWATRFDVRTGKPPSLAFLDSNDRWEAFRHLPVTAVVASPGGRTVLTLAREPFVRVWDNGIEKQLGRRGDHRAPVVAAAYSPDGRAILTGSEDHTARLWDAVTGEPAGPPLVHRREVTSVAFSPDGRRLLTGGKDHAVRLWDRATGQPLGRPCLHGDKVYAVAFSPDGRTLLSGGKDHTARLWAADTGRPLAAPLPQAGAVQAVAFHPGGRTVLTASQGGGARLWELACTAPREQRLPENKPVSAVVFSPDGRSYLVADEEFIWRWPTIDRPTGESLPVKLGRTGLAVVFSRDGKTILIGSGDGRANQWDVATGKPVAPPPRHRSAVNAVAYSPDGRTILTGSEDHTARLWDAATGEPIGDPLQHPQAVTAVAFSPGGEAILTGCWDGAARLWDTATGKPLGQPVTHRAAIAAVAFHPDGRTFLTASRDGTAQFWDAGSRRPALPPFEHSQPVVSAALSPDGHAALTCSEDGTARLWDTATGKPLGPALRHPAPVRAGAIHPAGHTVLTVSEEGTARLWPVASPVEGDAERVALWAEVITGLELTPTGHAHALGVRAWQERSRHLERLGGPPGRKAVRDEEK
jgi:WD40 repeat protein